MSAQLPLALRWPAQQRFDTYLPGDNAVALALLQDAARADAPAWVFVSGAASSGKTHLLLATCAAADAGGRAAQYLPLRRMREHAAGALRLQEKDGSWWDYPFYDYHQPYGTAFALMSLYRCREAK